MLRLGSTKPVGSQQRRGHRQHRQNRTGAQGVLAEYLEHVGEQSDACAE